MIELIRRLYRKLFLGIREYKYTNIYPTAEMGRDCVIGSYSEIGDKVKIGNRCKLGAYTFLPKGVTIGNEVFIGPKVTFSNDKYPKATGEWKVYETRVEDGASIGAGCSIVCGIRIGKNTKIGMGSVVTKDVPDNAVVYGVPAIERGSKKWKEKDYTSGFGNKEMEAAG